MITAIRRVRRRAYARIPPPFLLVAVSTALGGCASAQLGGPGDAPFAGACPAPLASCPLELAAAMLEAAVVGPDDVVYDLDCGDGTTVIEAARRRARAVGIETDADLLERAEEKVRTAGASRLVSLRRGEPRDADISEATVVICGGVADRALATRLRQELRAGARLVSHCSPIAGWEPEAAVRTTAAGAEHMIYLWTSARGKTPPNLAPFQTTPMPVVRRMLEVAGVTASDVVYDLGCGDGRIVVEAAKRHGARAVGIEYDRELCDQARARAERAGVADLVEIRHEDILEADFADATVVAVYLYPASLARLRPKLEALPRGTRIVSHDYPIGDWQPAHKEVVPALDALEHRVLLWRVGE